MEKNTKNKGRLFNMCSVKCDFWEWVNKVEMSGESSSVTSTQVLFCMFETRCRLTEEQDVEISLNMTILKERACN